MALRKDKIQALKDSLCLDNVDPATRSALNNLVDNLIPLFEATALPELGDLGGINSGPGISSGADTNPGGEDDMLGGTPPLGGGEEMPFDELGGFEDPPPGGGDDQGGGGGGGGVPGPCDKATTSHVTLLGKAEEDIPASKDGAPGVGKVRGQIVEVGDIVQLTECQKECDESFGKDIRELDEWIEKRIEILNSEDNFSAAIGVNLSDEIDDLRKQRTEKEKEFRKCIEKCRKEDNENNVENEIVAGTNVVDSEDVYEVKNISCEKIEKGTQVLISGLVTEPFNCGENDLYVIVEACGCD